MRCRSSDVIIILLGLLGVFFTAGAGVAAAAAFAAAGADFALALTAVCIDVAAGLVDFVAIVGALPAGLRDAEDLSFERLLPAMSFLLDGAPR